MLTSKEEAKRGLKALNKREEEKIKPKEQ